MEPALRPGRLATTRVKSRIAVLSKSAKQWNPCFVIQRMSAHKQWNRALTVLACRPGPERNECNRINARCCFELSRSSAYGGSVKRCPSDSVKSHRMRCGWSSSRRLVGSKIHTVSVHDELRRNQSRCGPSCEFAALFVGRGEFIAVEGGAQAR